MAKELTIIAGPNGAGKTTFALELIDEGLVDFFINADEIAKSLTGIAEEHRNISAGRLFLQKLIMPSLSNAVFVLKQRYPACLI